MTRLAHRPPAEAPRLAEGDPRGLLEALDDPAALCELDGVITRANAAWLRVAGRDPRSLAASGGLFAAFRSARRAGRGRGEADIGGARRAVAIARAGEDRFLVRLRPGAGAGAGAEAEAGAPGAAPPSMAPSGPAVDTLTAAAPFGAALIGGPDPFVGPILGANAAFWRLAGRPAAPDALLGDLIAPASRAEAAGALAEGRPGPFDVALAGAPDRHAELHLISAAGGTAAYLLDVTAKTALRLQLNQRLRMEAIGQLAGGVAHDFNNVLTGIGLGLDELLMRHPLDDPDHDNLSAAREGTHAAAALVFQLLTFSRQATVRREVLDLAEVLINIEVWLRRLLGETVRLESDHDAAGALIRADRRQLEMAIMNLVVNARDALKGRGGGVIRLSAARLDPARAAALGCPARLQGDLALIEVADDGPGIPPDVIDRIFEPFFTTKAPGEGVGLGLASVHGAVEQSGGWVIAHSPPGRGASFRIFLPVHAPRLVPPAPAPAPRPAPRDLSGAGRILFVEDDDRVRRIAARLLRGQGYEVIEARDGEEALEVARAQAGRIDLMISDVSMPGMSGPELLIAARPFLGPAPVMFVSGYARSEFSDLLEGEAGVHFLPKPLHLQSLAEQVKARLSGG